MKVSVIIPALNEEESIGPVIASIPGGWAAEVVVVDGGSRDRTVEAAQAAGARVVVEPRRGYGRACAAGARHASGGVLVFLDGDGADDPQNLPALVTPILQDQADLVLGSRLAGSLEDGAMPWQQYFGNHLAAWLFRVLYRLPITDLSPFRAVTKPCLERLDQQEMTFGWPVEMIARAARAGERILEVPVGYRRRLAGQSKISGTLRGTILATWYILKIIFRYARR